MSEDGIEYEIVDAAAQFDVDVGTEIQRAIYSNVANAYRATSLAAAKYNGKLARNFAGQKLRTEIEQLLLGMGARFEQVTATPIPNGNASHFHIQLRCRRILLTVAKTRRPSSLPRGKARYRNALYASNAVALFVPPNTDSSRPIFGVLAYGSYQGAGASKPDFVQVLFPHPNRREIVGMIDLHARYATASIKDSVHVDARTEEERLVSIKKPA